MSKLESKAKTESEVRHEVEKTVEALQSETGSEEPVNPVETAHTKPRTSTAVDANILTTLHNLYFSENKPQQLQPVDIALATYLILRQTDDHFIYDSQDTLATRMGCERKAVARSISRLKTAGWVTTSVPYQWNEKTKKKTRVLARTVGLSISVGKLPQQSDRAKRTSAPSVHAKALAKMHTATLVQYAKGGVNRFPKDFGQQQERAAQRLIDELESTTVPYQILAFVLNDQRFSKAGLKSLYEVRLRLKAIRKAFDEETAKQSVGVGK